MDWLVLTPPVVAIALALWTRQVFLALLTGLWLGTTILAGGNPVSGLVAMGDQLVRVFSDAGNTRIVFFCLLVGGLIALVQGSGGVEGFIQWVRGRGWGETRRGAELVAWVVGMLIFVESSITSLTVGAVSRPLFDRVRLPREKLAFYCDATSAPVCMSIPLNGWGAYVLGLLATQGIAEGVPLFAESLLFNFLSILAIVYALFIALSGWSFGPMRKAEVRAESRGELTRADSHPMIADEVVGIGPPPGAVSFAADFLIPITTMVGMIFVGLYITGDGDLMAGSGSTSVLWAVSSGIIVAFVLFAIPLPSRGGRAAMTPARSMDIVLKGCSGLVPVTVLIVLAFALGQVSRDLEMGPYVVGLIGEGVPSWWLPALVFVVSCFVSFTLGSSWTTFAIVIPIALPLAEGLGISLPLMLGAVLSGGVFGDLSSPLSDTSIISSMSAACDHVDHVNTQLPYALLLAAISLIGYLIAGLVV